MKITDAIVQIALDNYEEILLSLKAKYGSGHEGKRLAMKEALRASFPHLQIDFRIKQLEWEETLTGNYSADSEFTNYLIMPDNHKYQLYHLFGSSEHTSIEEAQSVAQIDYEKRVREYINIYLADGSNTIQGTKTIDEAFVRKQVLEEAASRLEELAKNAREKVRQFHAKQQDSKYGDRKRQHFYEEKKHYSRLETGYLKSAKVIRSLLGKLVKGD